jgi:hypothetical protein
MTSARACSETWPDFFITDAAPSKKPPDRSHGKPLAALRHKLLLQFLQRNVRPLCNRSQNEIRLALNTARTAVATRRFSVETAGVTNPLHQAHSARCAYPEPSGRRTPRLARIDRSHQSFAKIVRKSRENRPPSPVQSSNQISADSGTPRRFTPLENRSSGRLRARYKCPDRHIPLYNQLLAQ